MPNNIMIALAMVIGIGIINISIGIAALFLTKMAKKVSTTATIAGWCTFVILAISALGAICFLVALETGL